MRPEGLPYRRILGDRRGLRRVGTMGWSPCGPREFEGDDSLTDFGHVGFHAFRVFLRFFLRLISFSAKVNTMGATAYSAHQQFVWV